MKRKKGFFGSFLEKEKKKKGGREGRGPWSMLRRGGSHWLGRSVTLSPLTTRALGFNRILNR